MSQRLLAWYAHPKRRLPFIARLRLYLAVKMFPQRQASSSACGNRRKSWWRVGTVEYTLSIRDFSKPNAYSREELIIMLKLLREQEQKMGWKVPE